jgi:hypothetical protein
MYYEEFLFESGYAIQRQTTSNIRYNADAIRWWLLLRYVLDYYHMMDQCGEYEYQNRLTAITLLRTIAKQLGACNLSLTVK